MAKTVDVRVAEGAEGAAGELAAARAEAGDR
jgi:hypothetical protein